MGASSCQKGNRPDWTAKFWAGDSASSSILRAQVPESIACEDPKFDQYVCLSYDDLEKLETDVLSKCEKWSEPPAFINKDLIRRKR